MGESRCASPSIDLSAPRAVFAELLAGALDVAPTPPSPVATAYLVDLLADRLRSDEPVTPPALVALLRPGGDAAVQLSALRKTGDAALFVVGFFAQSFGRSPFGSLPLREAGRCAYAALSSALAPLLAERTFSHLYEELADRFPDFADLLAEVGERTCGGAPTALAPLYARYLASGSARDRGLLLARGALAPEIAGLLRPQ
jgi:hypothetical protein